MIGDELYNINIVIGKGVICIVLLLLKEVYYIILKIKEKWQDQNVIGNDYC